jgi:hypothetical protein
MSVNRSFDAVHTMCMIEILIVYVDDFLSFIYVYIQEKERS